MLVAVLCPLKETCLYVFPPLYFPLVRNQLSCNGKSYLFLIENLDSDGNFWGKENVSQDMEVVV